MFRHFMTVCVVCVLCAAHTSCSGHAALTTPQSIPWDSKHSFYLSNDEELPNDLKDDRDWKRGNDERSQEHGSKELKKKDSRDDERSLRSRRHTELEDNNFLTQLFNTYGDGTSMTIDGFERLLKKLGLFNLVSEGAYETPSNKSGDIKDGRDINEKTDPDENQNQEKKCLKSRELLSFASDDSKYETSNTNTTVPDWLFEKICPALVYQLVGESNSDGCVFLPNDHRFSHVHTHDQKKKPQNTLLVWVYSSISILIISLCGLLGVAVIPFMGKSYYNQVLQFLVALAVGCLCGDALIHLLPHAMMPPHSHSEHSHENNLSPVDLHELHTQNLWKGFTAMIGVVLFFFTEKALNMITEWRKRVQKRKKLPTRVKIMRETDAGGNNVVGEKLCKHKYSQYPYCYGEIATENQENHTPTLNHVLPIEEGKPLALNSDSVVKIMENQGEKKECENWKHEETEKNVAKHAHDSEAKESESYTVILREHETKHHGHTHSHGHVHSAPDSLSNVAWMVVMGDGLHNFADGMAIGAAFSANIAGGFSTAIAVFCHELPHELGDFAVLLKAGMSAKQAVFYNLLSSVLCIFGMVFGIWLGTTSANSNWMFSLAAGMFIYIALVDMVPELSSSHTSEGGSQWQFILQAMGLITGFSIMLIIALYEHDLEHIFSE